MGNKESTEVNYNEKDFKQFCARLVYEKDENNAMFGEIKIYKIAESPQTKIFVVNKKPVEDDYDNFIFEVEGRRTMDHHNLLKVYGYMREFDNNVCGTTRRLAVYCEWHKHTLERELMRRSQRKHFLTEAEMWFLLDSVVSAGGYLQEKNVIHGDLMPCNIFITEDGWIKIGDNGLFSKMKSAVNRLMYFDEKCYVAPEVLYALRADPRAKVRLDSKMDAYTLGMTILYAGTLEDSADLYDYLGKAVIEERLRKRIALFENKYSKLLTDQTKALLAENPKLRPDLHTMSTQLAPFRKTIRSTSGFDGAHVTINDTRKSATPFHPLPNSDYLKSYDSEISGNFGVRGQSENSLKNLPIQPSIYEVSQRSPELERASGQNVLGNYSRAESILTFKPLDRSVETQNGFVNSAKAGPMPIANSFISKPLNELDEVGQPLRHVQNGLRPENAIKAAQAEIVYKNPSPSNQARIKTTVLQNSPYNNYRYNPYAENLSSFSSQPAIKPTLSGLQTPEVMTSRVVTTVSPSRNISNDLSRQEIMKLSSHDIEVLGFPPSKETYLKFARELKQSRELSNPYSTTLNQTALMGETPQPTTLPMVRASNLITNSFEREKENKIYVQITGDIGVETNKVEKPWKPLSPFGRESANETSITENRMKKIREYTMGMFSDSPERKSSSTLNRAIIASNHTIDGGYTDFSRLGLVSSSAYSNYIPTSYAQEQDKKASSSILSGDQVSRGFDIKTYNPYENYRPISSYSDFNYHLSSSSYGTGYKGELASPNHNNELDKRIELALESSAKMLQRNQELHKELGKI